MNEERFWSVIEKAWDAVGGMKEERQKLTRKRISEDILDDLADASSGMIEALRDELSSMSKADLLAFDRVLERKLYDIDRAKVQERTDGSDDGFLYARGFIVAAGKDYYDAVNATPAIAKADIECEEMCYVSWHIYEERFGNGPFGHFSRVLFEQGGMARPLITGPAGSRRQEKTCTIFLASFPIFPQTRSHKAKIMGSAIS